MPDVANDAQAPIHGPLDWVGMAGIDAPIMLADASGALRQLPARIDAFVNLADADKRGIHMSRLYLLLDQVLGERALDPATLKVLLQAFLDSHSGLSNRARVALRFDWLVRRPALASEHQGWKAYPIVLDAHLIDGQVRIELATEVIYSSTCPCSAALARQLIQQRFELDFGRDTELDFDAVLAWLGSQHGICATPHSQRSVAKVRVALQPTLAQFPIIELIDRIEAALQTPVQTAVKREDEQAFARLNGANPMFCEDAARRIQQALMHDPALIDFRIEAHHLESLHPHDAVAMASKSNLADFEAPSMLGAPSRT